MPRKVRKKITLVADSTLHNLEVLDRRHRIYQEVMYYEQISQKLGGEANFDSEKFYSEIQKHV